MIFFENMDLQNDTLSQINDIYRSDKIEAHMDRIKETFPLIYLPLMPPFLVAAMVEGLFTGEVDIEGREEEAREPLSSWLL